MLIEERYKKIVDLVNEHGSMRVTQLSQICNVTEETIRRDLAKLEAEEKLVRSHGGAVSIQERQVEIPFDRREITNVEQKKKIAAEAVKLIYPNERIYLDASTTAWYTASIIPNIPLTVLTNSIKVALELSEKDRIDVIVIGGSLSQSTLSFIGPLAERSLENYFVDKAIISCKGIDLTRGLSDSNEMQARLKQKVMSLADKIILMADYSKFGVNAFTKVGAITSIHSIITDESTAEDVVIELKEKDIDVIVAN
ncbi:DeoR/GlpR family DNA-binding transcription regulator [Halalkalibacter urbisdiaboli]|uniref:DeoR/GlpR family DNA-binding transcription regulator n=1 Tax=Halalkalibacter urbisdiaboli TaxID=1960589 RepID=UPI000B45026F|nr:DeoR/GlpR family DNA-binding transcription regulator [Halalkalibacter urbisdiaboli]